MFMDVPLALMIPVIVLCALLIVYCLIDIARTDRDLLVRKWQWALAVLILVPIGAFAYVLFEKLGITQAPTSAPEELTTSSHGGGRLYLRDR